MVGLGGLAHIEQEAAARARLGVAAQLAHDLQALRVAERVQNRRQRQVLTWGVVDAHLPHCTTIIEQYGTMVVVLTDEG